MKRAVFSLLWMAWGLVPALFACSAHAYPDDALEMNTRFGRLAVVRSGEASPYDTIQYDGRRILQRPGLSIGLLDYVKIGDSDVVLARDSCGAAGCEPGQLYLVVLQAGAPAKIVTDRDFNSRDGTAKSSVSNGVLHLDLGWSAGRRKSAELRSGKLSIRHARSRAIPMAQDSCESLHEMMSECGTRYPGSPDCVEAGPEFLSIGSMNTLRAMANHPGYRKQRWVASCRAACEGNPWPYGRFKAQVCSIR